MKTILKRKKKEEACPSESNKFVRKKKKNQWEKSAQSGILLSKEHN